MLDLGTHVGFVVILLLLALRQRPVAIDQHLAIVYAEPGQEKEALAQAAEVLRISPGSSVDAMRERLRHKNPADVDRHISGLRKAGLK